MIRLLRAVLVSLLLVALPAAGQATDPFTVPADLAGHAVLSCQDLTLSGASVVTSEGLATGGAEGEQGHVRSNGDVLLDGGPEVHGDAIAGPGGSVVLSGKPATVTGEQRSADAPFDCTPIDLAALEAELEAANDNASIPPTEKNKGALGGADGRFLELKGRDTLELPAGRYLLSGIELTGNSRLTVAGPVEILVTGEIDVAGGSHLNLDGNPWDVRLWSSGASVSLASQSIVHAFLYAPAAELRLAGRSKVVGGVQGDSVELVGGSRVRRVVDDAPPVLTVDTPADGEVVEVCEIPVTGSAADGEGPATVTVNGVQVEVAADGTFSHLASLFTDDPGLLVIVATDRAGNETGAEVRVSIVPPTVALTQPPPGSLVGQRIVDLAGTSGTATEVTVNGVAAAVAPGNPPGDGTFTLAGFDLGEDGLVNLTLVASNCGGQVTATAVLDLDTAPPQVAIDSPSDGALFGATPVTVSGSVQDAHLDGVTVNGVAAVVDGQRFTAEGVSLSEGANTLVATATDALGRSTDSAPVAVELDTTAPTVDITSPATNSVVATPTVTVQGEVSDPNLSSVTVNGVAATVDGTGFSATEVPLAEGDNFLVATAVDALGNSAESPSVVVVLDTQPPTVTLNADELPALTDEPQVTATGTVSDPHLDTVTVNGVTASVAGEGWVAEAIPLSEGPNELVATATDTLGHTASTPPATVVLDTLAPDVAITAPARGDGFDSRTVSVTGTVSDPHLDTVTVLGVAAVVTDGTFTADGVELPEGESEIVARAVDVLGHAADSAPVPVVVDTLAPVVRLDSPEDPLVTTATVTVTGTAEDPHLQSVTVAGLAATLAPDGSFTVSGVPLTEGPNEITATASDSFGHSTVSEPVLYVLDTTPPQVTIAAPLDGQIVTSLEVTVTGAVTEANLATLQVDGVEAAVAEDGSYSVVVPVSDGANVLTAVATDRVGLTGEASVSVFLDTLPPAVSLDTPAAGACLAAGTSHTLAGAFADPNPATGLDGQPPAVQVDVRTSDGATATYAGQLSADGRRWSVDGVDLGAAEGAASATVTGTDVLGNASQAAASWRVDAAAPRVVLTFDGTPFAATAPGAAPPAGAQPALFNRAVAGGVQVDDGAGQAPPAASLTLDGVPYTAGTPIGAEGDHVLAASATDCAGRTTTVHAFFRIDRTPPALVSSTPAAGARLTTAPGSFSGSADEALSAARVDGAAASVSGTTFSATPFDAVEGDNEVAVELVDLAGNRSTHSVPFALNTAPLTLTIFEGGAPMADGAVFLRPVRPELRSNDPEATITANLDGQPFTGGSEVASPGTHTLQGTAADAFGRTANAAVSFEIDLGDGPTVDITSPSDGAVLPGPATAVTGSVTGTGVTVTVNGVPAVVAGDGTWTADGVPLEPDGITTLVAEARDARGRAASAGVSVRVTSSGPQVLILDPADGAVTNRDAIDVAGVVVGGARATADGTVTVSGLLGDPLTVALDSDGAFRVLDVPLAAGANTLSAEIVDPQGRPGSDSVGVSADFNPPAVTFEADGAPLAEGASFGAPITLAVVVSDDVGTPPAPVVRLNGADRAEAASPRTEIAVADEGGYVVAVVATDAAGNEARAERSFILDFGGCALAGIHPAAGSAVSGSTVTLTGRSGAAAAVAVRVGSTDYPAQVADGTFLAADVPLPAVGVNALQLVCTDAAGGETVVDHPIERLPAGDGPSVSITNPAAGALLDADAVTVDGTVTAGTVTVNGLDASVDATADTFSTAGVALVEGPNVLTARAVDGAGRSATDRVVVVRDNRAPQVQITRPDNKSRVGVPGSGVAVVDVSGLVDLDDEPHLATVVVSTSAGSTPATVDPETGAFIASGVPLDPGAGADVLQTVTVTATDELGHAGTSTTGVYLDPDGPAIVLDAPADLTWYGPGAPAQISVSGDAWAEEGAAVSVNGVDLDPAALAWEAPAADGRRHVRFTTSIATPASDGPFAVIARVTELDGGYAQDRRLLFRDTGPPRVVEMVPADGTTGVDPDSQALVLFSEPVLHSTLSAADGLVLLRGGTDSVAGSRAVAGQAAAFVPAAALAAGEGYTFRAGQGITDLAGNPLEAPFAASFTVGRPAAAEAPVLEPLPSVLCADLIVVRGTAVPGATVEVRDGDLAFRGFADPSGVFEVSVPSAGSGYHLLRVRTLDPVTGAASPEATAVLRIDCSAPRVTEARFERGTATIRVVFSEAVDPATVAVGDETAAIRLTDAEAPAVFQSATVTFVNDTTVDLGLEASSTAWWRERPVRLQVGPPAADLEGNPMETVFETVFFPGSAEGLAGGFLFGETYDDASGRPLGGATARLYVAGAALPGAVAEGAESAPVTTALTDGRGRYTFADDVPAGRYVLVLTADGHTPVYRRLALAPVRGTVPFDSRLTPRAPAAGSVDPATGGSVSAGGLAFTADAAALPGSDPLTVHLTALSDQGLPDFLPFGWTPAAAAEVHAVSGGAALPAGDAGWIAGGVRVEVPLPAWLAAERELVAVRHEPATGRWLALPVPERLAADASNPARARVAVTGPGTLAFVVADLEPTLRPAAPEAVGEPLTGVAAPETAPELTAELTLDPPVIPPTGRSRARVVARSVDGSTPWPAGLAVQAYLEEKLVLAGGGGQLLEAPFSVDLVLYHPTLTSTEQSGAAAGAAGAMEFVVSPSPRAAQVLLDVGYENIRLFPFPEEVQREPVVGPAGGGVESDDGVVLTIPEGALSVTVPASAELLPADDLAVLAPVAGFDTLAAVRVDLNGQTLGRPATLSVPVPDAPAETAGDPRLILAERIDAPVDGRGAYPRLVSRARLEGTGAAARVVASPDQAGALPLDGVVREGLYLVLRAQASLGYATGLVRGGAGAALDGARVVADGSGVETLGTADVTRGGGRYSVPVSAGADRAVRALHPTQDETAAGTLASLAAGAVATLDLTVTTVPPSVETLAPPDGAADQPVGSEVSVLFSEPLSAATVTGSTLTVQLAGPGGAAGVTGTGAFIDGAVSLVDGLRVVFTPDRPLPAGRTFLATFSGGVADAGGTFYAGAPVTWTFTTSTALAPGGQVQPELFHVRLPVDGVAEIYGEPGALPSTLAGDTPWIVSPEIEGPVADPVRDSFAGSPDGSFSGTVGHPQDFPATLGSRIWVKVFDPSGQLAAEFRVGPFETADGKGFVAPPGETVVFRSVEGIEVTAPAGAFDEPTVVRVETLDPATVGVPTPEGLGVGAYVRLDFEGQANESLRLAVPAPADAQPGAKVFVGEPVSLPWGRRLSILSIGAVEQRADGLYMSNAEELQPFTDSASTSGPSRVAGASVNRVTGRALPKSFRNALKFEMSVRSSAVWYYEAGAQWAFLAGSAGAFPIGVGIGMEAIYNAIADAWVYVPTPHDWNGGFILPVLADTPLQMVRRDTATGWILSETAYDPLPADDDGVIEIGFLPGSPQQPPLLTDARPFQLVRFRAPGKGVRDPLALEVEVEGTDTGAVIVSSVPDFALAEGTGLALFDLAPALPTDPQADPEAPKAGPTLTVCDDGQPWSLGAMAGSDEMLLAIAPGDLDAAGTGRFELQFDLPLQEIADKPPEQVARLLDLGPRQGCSSSTAAGYPRSVPVVVELSEGGSRLIVTATADLPAGHRFRLELETASLVGRSTGLAVWPTTPHRFEFGTREVPGEPVAGLPSGTPSLGTTDVARDMLKLGNLLLVASENGDLVAIDTSDSANAEGLRRHSIKNRGLQSFTRALATDGHNRIFYAGQFGPLWAIKATRLEDAREAAEPCANQPAWAAGLPCFGGVVGSVRVAYALGYASGLTASEWLAAGTLPSGTPMDMEVLAQDESGETLPLGDFAAAYGVADAALSGLTPDDEGIYTFDLPVTSTLVRSQSGQPEPSLPPGSEPAPAVAEWRDRVCEGEEDYDRYQRVTVDNLTTGQSWSVDVANPWPDEAGDGTATVSGIRARKGDRLRVRYNLRALGHVAIMGSGVTVVDLNRGYRLTQGGVTPGEGQCGRRLGKFEGQEIEWPSCAPPGIELQGMAMTPNIATLGETGCDETSDTAGTCRRGDGRIDVFTPLINVGVVHPFSEETDPGNLAPQAELAACIRNVGGTFTFLRDAVTATDVEWLYRGVHGDLSGNFTEPEEGFETRPISDDLLAVSLGNGGVFVFSVGERSVTNASFGPALVGHLKVPGHTAFRLQVDPLRKLLFAGGTDTATGEPVIDVWDLASINGAPGLDFRPVPRASLHAGWSTNHIGLDTTGTGLVYTWDRDDGGVKAVPFEAARFRLSGLYRPEDEDGDSGIEAEERPTARFVPLGVPVQADDGDPGDDAADERDDERQATAAFKVRVALPGSLGPELTARVQSLRALPAERHLGRDDVGAAVIPPGGPGWPESDTVIRLRRVNVGADEGITPANPEGGPLSVGYHLYESVETVLLLADPRARRDYARQDAPGTEADEEGQCRRCDWPAYLPDPDSTDPAADDVAELLAGRYVRVYLDPDPDSAAAVRSATEDAVAWFTARGANYPLPTGWAEVAASAAPVPSPLQVSLADPAANPAMWYPGEAGVGACLTGGELLLEAADHAVRGRSIPFVFQRHYRSGTLGYGPLGSAGWWSPLYSRLRELPSGEVEYHDGRGHVWRFPPAAVEPVPEGYAADDAGSYHVPDGLYVRLQKLSGGQGWRLISPQHGTARFDAEGRLISIGDRHHRSGMAGEQGSSLSLRYDPFGQLTSVIDDLGRRYDLAYYDDPRPVADGGDGPRYGLLRTITDFVDREIEYRWDADRRLTEVRLPEVTNPTDAYADFSYEGADRPTLRYSYDPSQNVTAAESDTTALLHGDFAALRLADFRLPQFAASGSDDPRARFGYDPDSGRFTVVGFPTPGNTNGPGSVEWTLDYTRQDAGPETGVAIVAPWNHRVDHELTDGRVTARRETLTVTRPGQSPADEPLETTFTYADDGRRTDTLRPDGGRVSLCYADGEGGAGCPSGSGGGEGVDRLSHPNVVAEVVAVAQSGGQPGDKGTADYEQILTEVDYHADNLPTAVTDGEGRGIDLAVPEASISDTTRFQAENVSADFRYDAYGRPEQVTGGGDDGPLVKLGYGENAKGVTGAGLVDRIERGSGDNTASSHDLTYDDAYNVEEVRTSYGELRRATHDEWDRPVREETGLSEGGPLAPVGAGPCSIATLPGASAGATVERAFDAAGHVVRERRLQDHLDPASGQVDCRWVETRFSYNLREQIVAVEQTHLSDPAEAGAVSAQPRQVLSIAYDQHGRTAERRTAAVSRPDLLTTYSYDAAGRVASTRTGGEGERQLGYDEMSRVVLRTDGDEGTWQGRFDVWDRVYEETYPTGAVQRTRFNRAHQPIEEQTFSGDPTTDPEAQLLEVTRYDVTSFNAVARLVEELTDTGERRVTEQLFDPSGRVTQVVSGPEGEPGRVDATQARRELGFVYEPSSGRVAVRRTGGAFGQPPLHEQRLEYNAENATPWPDRSISFESVPGQEELTQTFTTTFERDVMGRVLSATRSDGQKTHFLYDRGSRDVLRTRTAAGTQESYVRDGRGLPVKVERPDGRGATLYAYDLDGALLRQVTETADAADLWETLYTYDATGRVSSVAYADGTSEQRTYRPDSQVAAVLTRDGVTLTFQYDAANRLESVTPTAGDPGTTRLDAGDAYAYDELSRPTRLQRGRPGVGGFDPALTVAYPTYDLASRPAAEVVGARDSLSWTYDVFSNPVETRLPVGPGRAAAGPFTGFTRSFDTLDRLTDTGGLGTSALSTVPLGADWTWGGLDRLYAMDTRGALGTAARYGYHAGAGPQVPGTTAGSASDWKLGRLTWGANGGAGTAAGPTAVPATVWGDFGYGWRGNEGTPSDGAKIGRQVLSGDTAAGTDGLGLLAGLGWSWGYDNGVRLTEATSWTGDLQGNPPPSGTPADRFTFTYGPGDELLSQLREVTGETTDYETGDYGRITSRNGQPFSYDGVGRRLEDDRFVYRWDWRGQLVSVTVKPTWPDEDGDGEPDASPYAGHHVRYDYDATGRLTRRLHEGEEAADGTRPFIEERQYVWEGDRLAAEAAYAAPDATNLRWRRTYVPGPSGLDDPTQVVVEIAQPGSPYSGTTRTYTYLRDELGTVLGLVAEDEGTDPANPPIPIRYRYTPYGEAHAETGPELLRAHFDGDAAAVDTSTGPVTQTVADDTLSAPGALVLDWSLPLADATLSTGLVVEHLVAGTGWTPVDPAVVAVGPERTEGLSSNAPDGELLVLLTDGWQAGRSYRVRLEPTLADTLGRPFGQTETLEWSIPAGDGSEPVPAVTYDQRFPVDYESWTAAGESFGGRFPAGQSRLFQGLWADPVTGMGYARARWFDSRNATFLTEDPLEDLDSPNLYAFVGWTPSMAIDPTGLQMGQRSAEAAEALIRDLNRPDPPDSAWSMDDILRWKLGKHGQEYLFDFKEKWVGQYRETIRNSAVANDLPPELIGGVAFQEVGGDPLWIDDAAYGVRSRNPLGGKDPMSTSFGNVSIQLRRAAESFGLDPTTLTEEQTDLLIEALKDPDSNIQIASKHLADIRDKLFPGKKAEELTDAEISLIATAYNRGPELSKDELNKNMSYGNSMLRHLPRVQRALGGTASEEGEDNEEQDR